MTIASKLAWFTTDTGRKFTRFANLFAGFSLVGGFLAPHTLALDYYKDFVQLYSEGYPPPVPIRLLSLYDKVLKDMRVSESEQGLLKAFMVYGFDTFHAGSTTVKTGALIGIPHNFNYKEPSQVDRTIKGRGDVSVDWESQPGRQLQEALVLSEDAKKFAIAREICYARTNYVWGVALYPALAFYTSCLLASAVNNKFKLLTQPLSLRLVAYGLVMNIGLVLYLLVSDFTSVSLDHKVDDEASSFGRDYATGGVEYYDQMMKRNVALRSILGEIGKKLFSVTGNENNILFRQKCIPLFNRRQFLEEKLKDYKDDTGLLDSDQYIFGITFKDAMQRT